MRGKIRKIDLICLFSYIVLPLVLLIAIHHIAMMHTISNIDGGLFGESNLVVLFTEKEDVYQNLFVKYWSDDSRLNSVDYAVFQEWKLDDFRIRSLYFNDRYATFPMEEGRFLNDTDFCAGNNVAVIGKNYKDCVQLENGKKYITLGEHKFEVIGIMGFEKQSTIDDYIYINGLSDCYDNSRIFIVDCLRGKNVKDKICFYLEELNIEGYGNELISEGCSFEDSVLVKIEASKWFVKLILCTLISVVLISTQWIKGRKRELMIKKLLGATNKIIAKEILSSIGMYLGISFVLIYGVCYFYYPDYLVFLWLVYFMSVIIISLICLFQIKVVLSSSMQEVMNS